MKLTNLPVILLVSPELWSAHTVSKHHYALALARRGCKVLFLNPPNDSLRSVDIQHAEGLQNLYVISGPKIAHGLRFYPRTFRRWLEKRWLISLEKLVHCRISVIWLFENSRFFDMRFAGKRLKIYHQVDLNQDFQIKAAAGTADICFSTTDFISKRLQSYNSCVYKIHHGVANTVDTIGLPANMADNFTSDKIHAAYLGNLDICYLDVPLLSELVKLFPEVVFHFVGSYRKDGELRQACSNVTNVIWWGRVESALIPAILEKCDILLVTYLAEEFKEQLASPHKMMEYLASGNVVVATYTDEYKDKRHLLEMVDGSRDYTNVFARVVENLDEYNSSEKQASRIEYAQQHSYDRQLDKIFTLLKKHDLDKRLLEGNL
ncbi:MAG: glycosyltransferase [Mariprofundus sp.]|nr:glycosyltransferase [Mariprofundus sp.]